MHKADGHYIIRTNTIITSIGTSIHITNVTIITVSTIIRPTDQDQDSSYLCSVWLMCYIMHTFNVDRNIRSMLQALLSLIAVVVQR